MGFSRWTTVLAVVVLAACSRNLRPGDDPDFTDTGTPQNTDDTGFDTGEPSTPPDGDIDCTADYPTPSPTGGDGEDFCITDELQCGDVIYGTTVGGSTAYDHEQYDAWTCGGPATNLDWSAAERIYEIWVAPGQSATVRLYIECGALTLRTVHTTDVCPVELEKHCVYAGLTSPNSQIREHELFNHGANPVSARHEVVVDGRDGFEGNYRLDVICD